MDFLRRLDFFCYRQKRHLVHKADNCHEETQNWILPMNVTWWCNSNSRCNYCSCKNKNCIFQFLRQKSSVLNTVRNLQFVHKFIFWKELKTIYFWTIFASKFWGGLSNMCGLQKDWTLFSLSYNSWVRLTFKCNLQLWKRGNWK